MLISDERIGDYLVHPAAQLFPLADESSEEFVKLKSSIAEHGQQVRIVVRDGVLFDGRNRLRACLALGIPVKIEEYTGSLLASEMVALLNLERRNLPPEERARICAELELMTQAERQAAAQKEGGKVGGTLAGRGRPKRLRTDSCEACEPKTRAAHERSTVGRVAKAASVSYHVARKAVKKAKAKRQAGAAAPEPPGRKGHPPMAKQGVQRTHALLLEFAACAQPVPRAEITRRLGGKSPRDERRNFEAFFDRAAHVPWVSIEKLDDGFGFTINAQLRQLCEQQTPLPELNGWSVAQVVSFLGGLRRTITEMRAANKCERERRQWNTEASLKLQLLKLVEFIETELDKVTDASPKFPPAEGQVEKRPTQPSAGDADPTQGDSYVN